MPASLLDLPDLVEKHRVDTVKKHFMPELVRLQKQIVKMQHDHDAHESEIYQHYTKLFGSSPRSTHLEVTPSSVHTSRDAKTYYDAHVWFALTTHPSGSTIYKIAFDSVNEAGLKKMPPAAVDGSPEKVMLFVTNKKDGHDLLAEATSDNPKAMKALLNKLKEHALDMLEKDDPAKTDAKTRKHKDKMEAEMKRQMEFKLRTLKATRQ